MLTMWAVVVNVAVENKIKAMLDFQGYVVMYIFTGPL